MIFLCSSNNSTRDHWRSCLNEKDEDIKELKSLDELRVELDTYTVGLVLFDMDLLSIADSEGFIRQFPAVYFFMMCIEPNPNEGIFLAKAGARGYGNCWMHSAVINQAVAMIQAGELWLGSEIILQLIRGVSVSTPELGAASQGSNNVLSDLTKREKEIALRVANGENNKQIARALAITDRTVKAHLSTVFKKTHSKDRLQLALLVNSQSTEAQPLKKIL